MANSEEVRRKWEQSLKANRLAVLKRVSANFLPIIADLENRGILRALDVNALKNRYYLEGAEVVFSDFLHLLQSKNEWWIAFQQSLRNFQMDDLANQLQESYNIQ